MRLWHKDLIKGLPKQQLLGQWRECCLIAKLIHDNGTPNHILVNKIMDYPINHLYVYGIKVYNEMIRRGYNPDFSKFDQYFDQSKVNYRISDLYLFREWHNTRYLFQCYSNLEEKYDCGGITEEEWNEVKRAFCLMNSN